MIILADRSPYQGSENSAMLSQGVALGYDSMPLRREKVVVASAQVSSFFNAHRRAVFSANGATYRSLGQRPRLDAPTISRALKGRLNSPAPKVQPIVAQGIALGFIRRPYQSPERVA